ncbi:MAG: FtsW/RodA/SpoVE family cell cycle protein, partial [Bacteroidota bacterium]|nr:FtsW/RodA/SpoVE family cell cycle protein [Bacteroidota bacterium]
MNKLTRFDWNSLTVYLLLCTIGLINIYSIGYDIESNTMSYFNFNKQLFAFAIAILSITIIQFLDTKILERYASIFYLFGIFTLITVAVFGTEVSGSKSWFRLGSFN